MSLNFLMNSPMASNTKKWDGETHNKPHSMPLLGKECLTYCHWKMIANMTRTSVSMNKWEWNNQKDGSSFQREIHLIIRLTLETRLQIIYMTKTRFHHQDLLLIRAPPQTWIPMEALRTQKLTKKTKTELTNNIGQGIKDLRTLRVRKRKRECRALMAYCKLQLMVQAIIFRISPNRHNPLRARENYLEHNQSTYSTMKERRREKHIQRKAFLEN